MTTEPICLASVTVALWAKANSITSKVKNVAGTKAAETFHGRRTAKSNKSEKNPLLRRPISVPSK
jgi:hypothetical protein